MNAVNASSSTTTVVADTPAESWQEFEYRAVPRASDAVFTELTSHVSKRRDWPLTQLSLSGRVWSYARIFGICPEPKTWSTSAVQTTPFGAWLASLQHGAQAAQVPRATRQLLESRDITLGYMTAPHFFLLPEREYIQRGTSADMSMRNLGKSELKRSLPAFVFGADQTVIAFDGASNVTQHVCADKQMRGHLDDGTIDQAKLDTLKIRHPWQHDINSIRKQHGVPLSQRCYSKFLCMIVPQRDADDNVLYDEPARIVPYTNANWLAVQEDHERIETAVRQAIKKVRSVRMRTDSPLPPPAGMVAVKIHDMGASAEQKRQKKQETSKKRKRTIEKRQAEEKEEDDEEEKDEEEIDVQAETIVAEEKNADADDDNDAPVQSPPAKRPALHCDFDFTDPKALGDAILEIHGEDAFNEAISVLMGGECTPAEALVMPSVELFVGEDAFYEAASAQEVMRDLEDQQFGQESYSFDLNLMAYTNSVYNTGFDGLKDIYAVEKQSPAVLDGLWAGFPVEECT